MAKPTKFPAREWLLTEVGESLFSLTPDELAIFKLLAKEFYAADTQPGTSSGAAGDKQLPSGDRFILCA